MHVFFGAWLIGHWLCILLLHKLKTLQKEGASESNILMQESGFWGVCFLFVVVVVAVDLFCCGCCFCCCCFGLDFVVVVVDCLLLMLFQLLFIIVVICYLPVLVSVLVVVGVAALTLFFLLWFCFCVFVFFVLKIPKNAMFPAISELFTLVSPRTPFFKTLPFDYFILSFCLLLYQSLFKQFVLFVFLNYVFIILLLLACFVFLLLSFRNPLSKKKPCLFQTHHVFRMLNLFVFFFCFLLLLCCSLLFCKFMSCNKCKKLPFTDV